MQNAEWLCKMRYLALINPAQESIINVIDVEMKLLLIAGGMMENKIWNDYAGCWDDLPQESDCEYMRQAEQCPYASCPLFPCWDE